MGVRIEATGFKELDRSLNSLRSSQMPFAAALALTQTAHKVREAEREEMQRVFDRPTPFTLNAFQVVPARKGNLVAEVRTKGQAAGRHFLPVEAGGGDRPQTGFEGALQRVSPVSFRSAIPARAASRDAYGNWSAGERNRVLAALQQQGPIRSSGMMRSGRATEFYIGQRGDTVGVWRRRGDEDDLILLLTQDAASYSPRFDFYGVAQRTMAREFQPLFAAALQRAMATAR